MASKAWRVPASGSPVASTATSKGKAATSAKSLAAISAPRSQAAARRVLAGGGQRRGGAGGIQIDGDPAGRPRHPPGLGQIALPEPAGPQDAGFDDPAFGAGEIAVVVHSTTSGGVRRRRLPSRGRTISASPTTDRCHQRVGKEDRQRPVRQDHRLVKGVFRLVAQHHRQDQRRQRIVEPGQQMADQPEDQRQPQFEILAGNGIGADEADRDDDRPDDGEGDAQQRRERRHRRQHEDHPHHVRDIHAREQPPDEIGLGREQHRPRRQPPDHQPAHHHCGVGRGRHPSASIGSIAQVPALWSAASGATMPSGRPVPKGRPPVRDACRAMP